MPLAKVDELVTRFWDEGWIRPTKHCTDPERLRVKAELLILGALNVAGHHTPFGHLRANTEISQSEHLLFFHLFLGKMYSIRDEYIYYPRNMEELSAVMERYEEKDLPGCGGSIDVVCI